VLPILLNHLPMLLNFQFSSNTKINDGLISIHIDLGNYKDDFYWNLYEPSK
jgi:hypothetical protein